MIFVIYIVVLSSIWAVWPVVPFFTEEREELQQAPRFYVSYTWQAPGDIRTAPNATPSSPTTPSNDTTRPNESSPNATNSTPTVVSRTVHYYCGSVSKYARTTFKDYRCRFYDNEMTVVTNRSEVANLTNETLFEIVWIPKEGQSRPDPEGLNLSAESGVISPSERVLSIESPEEGGRYTLRVRADEGTAELSRPTLNDSKDGINITMYDQSRIANYRDEQFDRRTLPFQLLAIIVLWFGAIQLALSILNYRKKRGS